MNYRHAFHAGGFSDVLKHAVLALVIEHLKRKETPFCVVDTHAGVGAYDLAGTAAEKTGEWLGGIAKVIADAESPPSLAPYLGTVRALNPSGDLRFYPGSPLVARHLLRPGDRLMACELHPEDAALLADTFRGDAQAKVSALDGWLALKSFLPPKERRGLVLIDPPFEAPDEFDRIVRGLRDGLRRWATGIYLVWYPVKNRAAVADFHAGVAAAGIPRVLAAELSVAPLVDAGPIAGAGMLVVNPPWQLDDALRALLPWLARTLGRDGGGASRVVWLAGE
ncbi:MAG: 23S rRNA (adenine(2030)-N(6))-methyltransferase RlmJ [Rhodospirillales bacterium]